MTVQLTDVLLGSIMFVAIFASAPVITDMTEQMTAGPYVDLLASFIVPFLFAAVVIAVIISGVRND